MTALLKGSELSDDDKRAVAEKLHSYTGLPVDYLIRSDLRVVGGDFSKALKLDEATTIGRLDTRFQGPDINPLSEGADYDPQSDAISSAWTAAINDYLHRGSQVRTGKHVLEFWRRGWRLHMGSAPPPTGWPAGQRRGDAAPTSCPTWRSG